MGAQAMSPNIMGITIAAIIFLSVRSHASPIAEQYFDRENAGNSTC